MLHSYFPGGQVKSGFEAKSGSSTVALLIPKWAKDGGVFSSSQTVEEALP